MSDWAVRFDGVSKAYRRATMDYRTLRDVLVRKQTATTASSARRPALSGLTLEVQQGESYAFVGPNGAGKTSALRLVARISHPSAGVVSVRGRVGALMEVGSGIHPELTARENIWLYGSILGLSKSAIASRFDEILDFAELTPFVDRQVRYFSSGMQLRLGFAIASHLEPQVFVVDEALAVGDAAFQTKCLERMNGLVRGGATLLFVSHNLAAIEALCQSGVLLVEGQMVEEGPVPRVLRAYLGHLEERRTQAAPQTEEGPMRLVHAALLDHNGVPVDRLSPGQACTLEFEFMAHERVRLPHLNVGITDGRPGLLLQCSMLLDGGAPEEVLGTWKVSLKLEELPLRPRLYQVFCDVFQVDAQSTYYPWTEVLTFRVEEAQQTQGLLAVVGDHLGAPVHAAHSWRSEP